MSDRELIIRADGVPVPQGSKTVAQYGGKAWLRDSNGAKLKPWRALVEEAAREAIREAGWYTLDCPVEVDVLFWMPRPKSRKWWEVWVPVKPDLDKLLRSVFDSLTAAGVWRDDSRVVHLLALKLYEEGPGQAGVHVRVRPAEERRYER